MAASGVEITSISEVEQLVKRLYLPGTPWEITSIQETLQRLQRSPEGWQLADTLLGRDDDKVRFFGALTFTVKLNSDWETLEPDSIQSLLHRLVSWLIRLTSQSEGPLVGDAVPLASIDQYPPTPTLVRALNKRQAVAALWFISTLVEDVGKTDPNNVRNQKFHDKIRTNTEDAVALMGNAFTSYGGPGADAQLAQESMKCFQAWVFYSHRAYIDTDTTLDSLKSLTQPAIRFLAYEDLYPVTAELLTDVLSNYSKFLRPQDIGTLSSVLGSAWAQERFELIRSGNFGFESVQFGRFLLAFGDATVQDLARNPNDPGTQQLINMMHGLLTCDGYAVAEDEICVSALEFWSTFVEFMIDSLFAEGEDKAPWIEPARRNILQAIEECWAKIKMPPREIGASWDSESRVGFNDFRKDVADLLQAAYPLLGIEIFEKFINLALRSLKTEAWEDTEATLFCLNALSDCVSDDAAEDEILGTLFGSSMFSQLSESAANIPAKTRQTSVNLLGHYAPFFERHTEYLPAALTFLFGSVEAPALARPASRSIFLLCSSCRNTLTSELGAFLEQYSRSLTTAKGDTKEKVLGAIASIIQAIPSEEAKAEPIQRILEFIENDVHLCISSLGKHELDVVKEPAITALRCLTSVGKGLQALDDTPIELDSEADRSTFWDGGFGASIQVRIVKIVDTVVEALSQDGDVIEAGCFVYRAGFTEAAPGPFVFPPGVTTRFLLRSRIDTPRLEVVLTTACALVNSHSTESSTRIDREAAALLKHVSGFIHAIGDPAHEPDVAQNCVDFLARLMPRYVDIILGMELKSSLEEMFFFALKCLTVREPLPKRSAASFWSSFVILHGLPEPLQLTINGIMQHLGPLLAEALMTNIAGGSARSELDTLAEPLKKLVFRQPRAKAWLETALFNESFPSGKVDASEKRLFLQKVMT
ncbi:MAG: hypothetical protein M1839_001186 [Geoglossum umbratile]|nr:MAG: hypothetical protein M1839_001186 [Geoglossum umbratile]